ncbi:MAG: hypothetical protein J4478_03010 [Candidatus Diapherotrites archaeon]|uniref:Uncharacterized protein n=1 Tax=Candidatus Iainarchaeum sp. TaxID=3101447 RepID=A0A7J4L100_9ARCH|nr:hypothetical protein [Candidatus Diapherotrites archaeon]HIH33336.1 hypothetical protein [Candidatus Diapherotrites archaeon]
MKRIMPQPKRWLRKRRLRRLKNSPARKQILKGTKENERLSKLFAKAALDKGEPNPVLAGLHKKIPEEFQSNANGLRLVLRSQRERVWPPRKITKNK